MAFIRTATVNNKKYTQVAEYWTKNNERKIKIIKSFGPTTPKSVQEADIFLYIFSYFKKLRKSNRDEDFQSFMNRAIDIGSGVFAVFLGSDILKWIHDNIGT